jgi:hypothetical protein
VVRLWYAQMGEHAVNVRMPDAPVMVKEVTLWRYPELKPSLMR